MYAGSHAVSFAAVMSGHNVVSCEMLSEQHSHGKRRMLWDLKQRLDARKNCRFQMSPKWMDVHQDDVDKPLGEMRWLPNPILFGNDNGFVNGVDMSQLRKRVAPLKVLCFSIVFLIPFVFAFYYVSSFFSQGGCDQNQERVMLWYWKAHEAFKESTGQRKITDYMTSMTTKKKGLKVKEVDDSPPSAGPGLVIPIPDGDVPMDVADEIPEGVHSLEIVPGFHKEHAVDTWSISGDVLTMTLRGKTVSPPVLGFRWLSLPQAIYLSTPDVQRHIAGSKGAVIAVARVIVATTRYSTAELVQQFQKAENIDSDWYGENTRVIFLQHSHTSTGEKMTAMVKHFCLSMPENYLGLQPNAAETEVELLDPQFESGLSMITVADDRTVYTDFVEDCLPAELRLEAEEDNKSYFGESEFNNCTDIFISKETVLAVRKQTIHETKDVLRAFQDGPNTEDKWMDTLRWSVRVACSLSEHQAAAAAAGCEQ